MADLPDRNKQNQALLQELETQRLHKTCNHSIDLRGKVANKCQQYEAGDCLHYLDDHSYLLLKQLMARFDNRFTVGVYEALLKATRRYSGTTESDANHLSSIPQLLSLDSRIERQEQRLIIKTSVDIKHGDLHYFGSTVDIASHSLRIVLKRIHTLAVGDIVNITFTDWLEQQPVLAAVQYRLIRIEHQQLSSTIVLIRQSTDSILNGWFEKWLIVQAETRPVDRGNELLNLQSTMYQRIWLSHQASPVIWLTTVREQPHICTIHLTPVAQALLQQQHYALADLLQLAPLQKLITASTLCLLAIDHQHAYLGKLVDDERIQQLLAWQQAGPDRRLVCISANAVEIDIPSDQQAILDNVAAQAGHASNQLKDLITIQHNLVLTDISNIAATVDMIPAETAIAVESTLSLPEPTILGQHVRRADNRFYIKTPVTAHIDGQAFSLETLDVSVNGLSLQLPVTRDRMKLIGKRLEIDFIRWQTLGFNIKLTGVPYIVKNALEWQGQLRLGLQRVIQNCPASLNRFFTHVIEQNQYKLQHHYQDQQHWIENQVLQGCAYANAKRYTAFPWHRYE